MCFCLLKVSVEIVFLSKRNFPECPQSKALGSNVGRECESEGDKLK